MLIFVSPISGGSFPCQLALMTQFDMIPDLCLGASGGNVAHYLWLACDRDVLKLIEILKMIKRDMFVKGDKFTALLRGHFLKGDGVTDLFKAIFTETTIQRSEVITLACDDTKIKPTLFSNKSKENSFFKDHLSIIDDILYQVDGIEYLDGDLDKISTISLASASIPGIAMPQEFENEYYVDGGVCYASALTPLAGYLREKLVDPVQIVYFSCYNMTKIAEMEKMVPKMIRRLLDNSHFSALQDRAKAVELFASFSKNVKAEFHQYCTKEHLQEKLKMLEGKSYCLILYPEGYQDINILNFSSEDIFRIMDETILKYSYYLWYNQ